VSKDAARHRRGKEQQPWQHPRAWVDVDARSSARSGRHGVACYGTPGISRAQQLAGIAIGDPARRRLAEQALAACLTDPAQVDSISDASLCHGWAGLLHTVRACAGDTTIDFTGHLACLTDRLVERVHDDLSAPDGFLEGAAGAALALHAGAGPTAGGWDACLLIA
jgi:hypothetical protein